MEKNWFILLLLVLKEMFKRGLIVVVLSLVMFSIAHASAIITLTALTPENSVGGYLPGTFVDFQIDISQDTGMPIELRLAQLDFSVTDPGLTFSGGFSFDFSSLISNALYTIIPSYPVPRNTYNATAPIPGFILEIPASGSLTLGIGLLELPGSPGSYLLDALNAGTNYTNLGAQIYFDFANPTRWSSWEGSITGSPLELTVVPIPSAIWFLGSVLVGLMGFRMKFRKA